MKFQLQDGESIQNVHIDEDDKGNIIVSLQSVEDVTAILEANKKAQRDVEAHGRRTMGQGTQTSMYQLGELSALQVHELMKQGIWDDDAALRRWFNDLDNELWRIDPKVRRSGI